MAAVAIGLTLALAAGACGGSTPSGGGTAPGPPTTLTTPTSAAPSGYRPAVERGQLADAEVTESSGLVASRRHPGRLWTHNDSGNPPVLFCVEPDGGSCGRWTVDGADNFDWEDVAAGPGPQPGEHYLYVGDIGDNTMSRDDVVVYRVVEPTTPAGANAVTSPATTLRLRYDDGPHDAEALMVHPATGDLYVVTKAVGDSGVYKAPAGGGALTRIATLGLGPLELVTGADISPDGRRVALCGLFGGFELTLDGTDGADPTAFDAVWPRSPVPVALPARGQGEAIAYRLDGDALLLTSEGYPSPLFELPRG